MRSPLLLLLAALGSLTACGNDTAFVGGSGIHAFAMTDMSPPVAVTRDAALYLIESRIELDIVPPTPQEMTALQRGIMGRTLPFVRMPWVSRGDMDIELDFALTNLTPDRQAVAITVNGFNEFHEYLPTFDLDAMDIIPHYAQWERSFDVGPYETVNWTVRQEEMDEVEVDLATVVNGAPNANLIVYPGNHSSTDARAAPYIPAVIPGLTGCRMGIRTEVAANLVVETSVRVRDHGGRLAADDQRPWTLPVPLGFMPVPPMP